MFATTRKFVENSAIDSEIFHSERSPPAKLSAMAAPDLTGWLKSTTDLWERGSLFLWALAAAALVALGLSSLLAIIHPAFGTLSWTPWCGLALVVMLSLA